MLDNKGHPNRLGIWGLGLLLYFLLHIFVTSGRAFGPDAWKTSMDAVSGPRGTARGLFFTVGEFLVFAAFAFHALNGVRLALIELGFAIGKPIEPIYPYRTSVHEQRPLAIVVMVVAGIVLAAGGYNFLFHLSH